MLLICVFTNHWIFNHYILFSKKIFFLCINPYLIQKFILAVRKSLVITVTLFDKEFIISPSGHLLLCPIVGLACAPIVETRFLELAMSLLDFSPRILLGTFSIFPWQMAHYLRRHQKTCVTFSARGEDLVLKDRRLSINYKRKYDFMKRTLIQYLHRCSSTHAR